MKVFDAFNRVMSGRRKQRDDRPFPPDLIRDEHAYLNNFAGSRNVVYSSGNKDAEKIFDSIHLAQNDMSRNYTYYQIRHAGNPYIVHSGKTANQSSPDQSFVPFHGGEQQLMKTNQSMAFTLPPHSTTSDYGSSKSNLSRRRHGSFSNSASPNATLPPSGDSTDNKGCHQRSRSSSGGYRQIKLPANGLKSQHYTMYSSSKSFTLKSVEYSIGNDCDYPTEIENNNAECNGSSMDDSIGREIDEKMKLDDNNCIMNEPIYSEPLPPTHSQVREAEHRTNIKYFPDPNDPVQISNHIYEYLVKKSKPMESKGRISQKQPPLPPLPHDKR